MSDVWMLRTGILIAGVLLSVVVRKRRSSKRLTFRHVLHTRRAAV